VYSHCYEGVLANSKVSRKQNWNDRSWPILLKKSDFQLA